MTNDLLWFALAVVVLALGGDSFARGATALAMRAGVRATTAGIVFVAFAGSLPDLAVNITAVMTGHAGLALGNIVGSALVNIGLVLGVAALAQPLQVRLPAAKLLLPALIVVPALLMVASHNGRLGYYDGAGLVGIFLVLAVLVSGHRETHALQATAGTFSAYAATRPSAALNMLRLAIGAVLLWYGAFLLVPRAASLAEAAGVSEIFFGLTAVAFATSLPQVIFAIVAARRGHGAVVFTSVTGSNLFNLLLILGVTALLQPLPLPVSLVQLEFPALIAFAIALYPMLRGNGDLSRGEGGVLAGAWVALSAFQIWMVMR